MVKLNMTYMDNRAEEPVGAHDDWTATGATPTTVEADQAAVTNTQRIKNLADLLPSFSKLEDETGESDLPEILAEIDALDPQLNQAVTELFDENGELREECMTLESINAISQDGALDNSPKLKAYMENYLRQSYGSAEQFEAEITGYINNQDPENATDMLILMARFGDPEEQENIQKLAQNAYAEMLIKGQTDPRYAFEAELLRQNLPFELDERNDLKQGRRGQQASAEQAEQLDTAAPVEA